MLFVLSVESRMETGQKLVENSCVKHKKHDFYYNTYTISKQLFEHLTDLRVTSVTLTTSQIITITEVTKTGTSIRNCA